MNTTAPTVWQTEAWNWVVQQTSTTATVIQDQFPHVAEQGEYDRREAEWWTAGFWPGLLWLVHSTPARPNSATDSSTQEQAINNHIDVSAWAESCEVQLEQCLYDPEKVDHDLGFTWLLSGVAHYRLSGNLESRRRGLLAANLLAARYNVRGRYIRAWNFGSTFMDTRGVAIIDSMMNLPLLYWASKETGDPRYQALAIEHADTIAKEFVREDHSICHAVEFDPFTGEKVKEHGGQGFAPGSAWARGTAWALHGFALSYAYTGEQRYLEIAKQTAQFFLTELGEDIVPFWDFRAPDEHRIAWDSSAAAIAASGLLELARHVPEQEQSFYQRAGELLVQGLYEQFSSRETGGEGLISKGTVHYPEQKYLNVSIIYGDYFFAEALVKLQGKQGLFTPEAY
ncbi:unsaturated chondroitin disaccharide hydrolase [Paenibacillus sp. SORGH_AS306]|uniref:glycoside hydrolase family 88 protein n=1 Tax=unclassified Paenibacillus TaxID=185978 RepID=UPI002789364B|nr:MULTISPECIES: glycoside hydrolase family 88 protein [unclassified Paenibacillus]MDQ1234809.1 unsaturated chondroitin disaccharide hydrolase [Paenibacillus sp. SORGH_AS_0306]MDR6111856.1 unsaturated chondroitin disaccharide hydrolase [Paenibacillus sp. SORGH_AS_0338]